MFSFILQNTGAITSVADKLSPDSLKTGTRQLIDTLTTAQPGDLLRDLAQEGIHFGLKVIAALLIYLIGGWIIKLIRKGVNRALTRKKADVTLISFINSLVSITLWVILIILTISTLGINTSSLAALLAAGGMAIGMALGGTVQNFAGGIMLLVFKPFKSGDLIEAQGLTGKVTEINMVSTKLTTLDNRIIIIPNGALSGGNINNISALPIRRVDTSISVSYGSDAEKVKSIILDTLKEDPRVLDATTDGAADPFVALKGLGSSSVDFVVRAWTASADYWDVLFRFNESIYRRLPEQGISFPFQQMDVHIKQ